MTQFFSTLFEYGSKKYLYRFFFIFGAIALGLSVLFFVLNNMGEVSSKPLDNYESYSNRQLDVTTSSSAEVQSDSRTIIPHPVSDLNETIKKESVQSSGGDLNQLLVTQAQGAHLEIGYGIAAGGGLIHLGRDEINQYFESLKSLGIQWVRWDIDWSVVEANGPSQYDWAGVDRVVDATQRFGIKSLGIITYTPKWARNSKCVKSSKCSPKNPDDFGHFSGMIAQRYGGKINALEIWNEPNYTFFWAPRPDAKKYAALLESAFVRIKKVNPEAVVLGGGLAATGNEKNGNISPLTFMNSLYSLGANHSFDAVALHPYSYPASPNNKVRWNGWQQIMPIHNLMVKKGDDKKQIWITEFGAPTGGPGKSFATDQINGFRYNFHFMKESAQSDMVDQALKYHQKNSGWMGPFFWYSLKDVSARKDTTENFFGLLRYDGSKKPAYDVFKKGISSH